MARSLSFQAVFPFSVAQLSVRSTYALCEAFCVRCSNVTVKKLAWNLLGMHFCFPFLSAFIMKITAQILHRLGTERMCTLSSMPLLILFISDCAVCIQKVATLAWFITKFYLVFYIYFITFHFLIISTLICFLCSWGMIHVCSTMSVACGPDVLSFLWMHIMLCQLCAVMQPGEAHCPVLLRGWQGVCRAPGARADVVIWPFGCMQALQLSWGCTEHCPFLFIFVIAHNADSVYNASKNVAWSHFPYLFSLPWFPIFHTFVSSSQIDFLLSLHAEMHCTQLHNSWLVINALLYSCCAVFLPFPCQGPWFFHRSWLWFFQGHLTLTFPIDSYPGEHLDCSCTYWTLLGTQLCFLTCVPFMLF